MGRVVWTSTALDQLEEIRAYIAQFDPVAADRFRDRIVRAGERLDVLPGRGRPLVGGDRQLSTVRPYLIRYREIGDDVIIRSIRHGARRQDQP